MSASELEIELAEALLASLLGLFASRAVGRADAPELLNDIEQGRSTLRFVVHATGNGAQLHADVLTHGGIEREVLHMTFCPKPGQARAQGGSSPIEQLGTVYAALGESTFASHIPAHVRNWLRDSIAAKVRKGGTLDAHTGLSGRGKRDLGAVLDLHNRDMALVRALHAVADENSGLGLWDRCKRLAPLVRVFGKQDWSRGLCKVAGQPRDE